ncbi:MAG: glycosyltransferase, partial [Nitrospira sp.]|nr:glycosyltransferase [Nitrospira sp.]
ANIEPTATGILAAFGPLASECEILFVDDNSPDGTAEEVLRTGQKFPQVKLVQHGKKEGLGAAHHAGYHAARGEYILCIDADFSQSPRDLVRMKEVLDGGQDLVVGSRYMKDGEQIGKSLARDLGSKAMNLLTRVCLGIFLADSTHTFRAFRRTVHESVCRYLSEKGHPSFQIQFTFWAVRRGFRVTEIPIRFVERAADKGRSKLSIRREFLPFLRSLGRLSLQRLGA